MDAIYLIHSKDSYLASKKVKIIVASFNLKMEDVLSYDEDETDFKELVSEWNTISFFGDKRIFWIKDPKFLTKSNCLKDGELSVLSKYLKNPMDTTILIFTVNELALDSKAYKELKKFAKIEEITSDNKNSMNKYAQEYFKSFDIKVEDIVIAEIISRVTDYQNLNNEIEKLAYYALKTKKVTFEIVDKIVSKNLEHKIYDLTNALLEMDKDKIYRIYRDLMESNEEPLRIINNISTKLRDILYTQKLIENRFTQDDIANKFGVSRGRAYYLKKNAQQVPYTSIVKYLEKISDIDYEIKSGQVNAIIALELFLLGV